MIDKTVEYYNENADSFFETTVHADMSLQLKDFVKLITEGGCVLDAGESFGDRAVGINADMAESIIDIVREVSKYI